MVWMASIPSVSKDSFKRVLRRFHQREPAVADLSLAFQHRVEVIERVEGVRKFAGIGGKDMRAEFGDHPLDDLRELGNLLCKGNLLFGLEIEAFREMSRPLSRILQARAWAYWM